MQVLGDGVSQLGSLVDESRARFDFSHSKAMTVEQIKDVEDIVRTSIRSSLPVSTQIVPLDKAKEINNLRAVFGERYPDPVRVVSIGPTVDELLADPSNEKWNEYSIEFCGGTHVSNTDVLSEFALVEETAVAKGVRRVVGITGEAATNARETGEDLRMSLATSQEAAASAEDMATIESVREQLKNLKLAINEATISAHLKPKLREDLSACDLKLSKVAKQLKKGDLDGIVNSAVGDANAAAAAGRRHAVLKLDGVDPKSMQTLAQRVLKESGIAVLVFSVDEEADKVACIAAVPDEYSESLSANSWLQTTLKKIDGRGGGKKNQAQGSGTGVDKVSEAIDEASAFAESALLTHA